MAKTKEPVPSFEDIADATDAPILETVGGKPVSFRLLELDDLGLISREVNARDADKALAGLPMTAGAEQRENVRAYYRDRRMDVNAMSALTQDFDGCQKFLVLSLCPPGLRGDDARAARAAAAPVVRRLVCERGWRGAARLAAVVSGIFAPEPPPKQDPDAGDDDPNSPAAGGAE